MAAIYIPNLPQLIAVWVVELVHFAQLSLQPSDVVLLAPHLCGEAEVSKKTCQKS